MATKKLIKVGFYVLSSTALSSMIFDSSIDVAISLVAISLMGMPHIVCFAHEGDCAFCTTLLLFLERLLCNALLPFS